MEGFGGGEHVKTTYVCPPLQRYSIHTAVEGVRKVSARPCCGAQWRAWGRQRNLRRSTRATRGGGDDAASSFAGLELNCCHRVSCLSCDRQASIIKQHVKREEVVVRTRHSICAFLCYIGGVDTNHSSANLEVSSSTIPALSKETRFRAQDDKQKEENRADKSRIAFFSFPPSLHRFTSLTFLHYYWATNDAHDSAH